MKDIRTKLRKFLPTIRDAKEKGLNEADTRMRIRLLLSDVLSYDLLEDITQEDMIQSHYVDMTVKARLTNEDVTLSSPLDPQQPFVEILSGRRPLPNVPNREVDSPSACGGVVDSLDYFLTYIKKWLESITILAEFHNAILPHFFLKQGFALRYNLSLGLPNYPVFSLVLNTSLTTF